MLKINHKGHELTIICGLEQWRVDAVDSAGFTWALRSFKSRAGLEKWCSQRGYDLNALLRAAR